MKKYETWCPLFPGFYGTEFEYDSEESDIQNYNEENGTDFDWDDFNWDYLDYHKRASHAFNNKMESELKSIINIKMDFQELYSPREYNFYTDSIWVEVKVSVDRLLKLIKANYAQAESYFANKYTSCSGFISFHSNNIDTWLDKKYIMADTRHRIGALLDCLATIEGIEPDYDWISSESHINFSQKEQPQPIYQLGETTT